MRIRLPKLSWSWWLSALAFAMIGGAAGTLGALAVVGFQARGGLSAGDVLQFFGGILGTGLAIAGALWVEGRKRRADIADRAKPVLDALLRLEDRSRPFFHDVTRREHHAEAIRTGMKLLDRTLMLAPPNTAQLIGLFDRLKEGAEMLTGELYLLMNEQAPMKSAPERHRVEELLEAFDAPLKLLIVEYSRLIDRKGTRSVPHLGRMPEI
ncbi:hypothetical protein [Sphingomonas sp.]|jgi:hypothetical protein|uniref:hypothetical protein n=1 Tax=Sphingomonas sp. TaxID=28214 RepID=UPI002E35617E|nr:hypothetical protein [Sphingomonas sp.]HEX4693627.1 hypothetical protein [Sphingomonas sp.]